MQAVLQKARKPSRGRTFGKWPDSVPGKGLSASVVAVEPTQNSHNSRAFFHYERQRLKDLFTEAARYPFVVVCAGAGYGKTSAVLDFLQSNNENTAWVRLSAQDNVCARYWESFTRTIAQVNAPLAKALAELGFPTTVDALNQCLALVHKLEGMKRKIYVMDDFHCIENPVVLNFIEQIIHYLPVGTTMILISRCAPRINTASLIAKGCLYSINEDDLQFTDEELSQYFNRQGLSFNPDCLREIMQDTGGWAFAINLVARSYQKAPGYGGYLRKAMKDNIFTLMRTEVWNGLSGSVQRFLSRLSLIDHLSYDLISLLAEGDEDLIAEMEKQNAYIRRDSYINAYIIHPLFLEFLSTEQDSLPEEIKRKTYAIAGAWCSGNGFKTDAMTYFEKTEDYRSIVSILLDSPAQISPDIAKYAAVILDRAPKEAFNTVESLAVMHLRSYMSQGLWQEAHDLAEHYEAEFLSLPKNDPFRTRSLCGLYFYWAYLRGFTCLTHDRYDFDTYFEKFCNHLSSSFDHRSLTNYCSGPWIIITGSSWKGAPQEYIDALSRSAAVIAQYFNGFRTGEDDMGRGELAFYRGDIKAAETLIPGVIELARKAGLYELIHRALLYIIRISVAQGNYAKAQQALKGIEHQLEEDRYHNRYVNYDIALSWYYCLLDLPDKVTGWLKQDFSEYSHAGFTENFANQVKARYCYITRNYPLLLSYIQNMKQRESFLFGRVEMLAMEACVYSRIKQKKKALAALEAAYETASPNGILMPFIEMGKDMRTLTSFILKEKKCAIPRQWLEDVSRKSATYAKHRSHFISKYLQANKITDSVVISPQETEILKYLSHGLSRAEIAASRELSINTVKMTINNISSKLGAKNLANLIRIATEKKMI